MAELFSQVLNMSVTGSLVILCVMAARLLLKRFPKIYSYTLWSVVLFRLLCPAALTGPVSLLNVLRPQSTEAAETVTVVTYLPAAVEPAGEITFVPAGAVPDPAGEAAGLSVMEIASCLWAAGVLVMLLWSLGQYFSLKRKLLGAVRYRGNVYLADHIGAPFVMGIAAPKIYLPSNLPPEERKYIIAHERHHIRRLDPVLKLLGYVALCIHWFNPLAWAAFHLAGKDMEMSCDEAVIRKFGPGIRAEYAASLLRLATHRKILTGMPLAFGEGDTKGRVMNMAKWKKPELWISVLCLVLCAAVLAACAVNPLQETAAEPVPGDREAIPEAFSEERTNILITAFESDEAAGAPDTMLILSVDPQLRSVAMGTVLRDVYVSLPDYKGHITGSNKISAAYSLGRAWDGREGAEYMLNQCIRDHFGIRVDHNMELTGLHGFPEDLTDILRNLEDPNHSAGERIAEEILVRIAGTEDPQTLRQTGERLAQAQWSGCTVPGEGTYSAAEVTIGGTKVPVLVMNSSANDPRTARITEGLDIVTDTSLVRFGGLELMLTGDYGSYEKDGAVVLTKDGTEVGGIRCYRRPEVLFGYSIEYLRALGLPEAQETEAPIAYMISNNMGGGIYAEFFHELEPLQLNAEHHIYPDGELVYDVYFDKNILDGVQTGKLIKTLSLNDTPMDPAEPEEGESLILCRNILDLVQSGAHQIRVNRENQGDYALNRYSDTLYTGLKENWISITHVPDDDSYFAYMDAEGVRYSNEGNGWAADGSPIWSPDPYPDVVGVPWLAGFRWRDEVVSYIDTFTDEEGKTVKLMIGEPFPGYEDLSESYLLDMNFTEEGSFLNAEITVYLTWQNSVSSVTVKESIVTLDEPAVLAYMEAEYTRAASEG